jgi:hypothetical protein
MANQFKNQGTASVGTTATTVYTAPALTTSTVIGLTVANTHSAPIYVNILITINSSDFYLIKQALIPVGGALVPVGGEQKLVLEPGDAVKVLSSVAASADVIVSALEIS